VHTEALTQAQRDVLDGIASVGQVADFYLAGGTALALRHAYRRSIDFDWFRETAFDSRRLVAALDDAFGAVERLPSGEHTLYVRIRGVPASFFKLPYPLLEPTTPTPWGFGLASDQDIAAMKLEAIAGRGSRKDFVDLHLLCQRGLRLEEAFRLFERKYGVTRMERYHRLRALTYFDDAEREPMPELLCELDWKTVRDFFVQEARRLLAAQVDDL
jgi:hypothetical protein